MKNSKAIKKHELRTIAEVAVGLLENIVNPEGTDDELRIESVRRARRWYPEAKKLLENHKPKGTRE